jgi:hypothetical protein
MESVDNFKQLARELSPGEQASLLQRLNNQITLTTEPLYEDKDKYPIEIEEEYARLPWYYQLFFCILSFFSSKSPFKIYQDRLIANLGRLIDSNAPGFYDHSKTLLLPGFYRELVNLKESARFFFNILDICIDRDRGAFYAFLGSLEMDDVHNRLMLDTDPETLAIRNSGASPAELRRIAYRKMEDAINLINEDQRTAMYENIRSLNCLKQLASFSYDRVIMAFSMNSAVAGMTCSALSVRDLLSTLNNILFSLRKTPPKSLFESLFVFIFQEKIKEPGVDIDVDEETRKFLAKVEQSLEAIRNFNRMASLTLIIRCISRDLSLSPVLISGGEDWLAVYQGYWKQFIKDRVAQYLRKIRSRELEGALSSFFKGANLKLLTNVESTINPGGIPIKEAISLSFLRTYYAVFFAGDNTAILNTILINGEFYNRDNQLDFSKSYNELNKIEEVISGFDAKISPAGDFGSRYTAAREELTSLALKRVNKLEEVISGIDDKISPAEDFGFQYAAAREELTSLALKQRRLHAIINEVNRVADQIIEQNKAALITMVNVLNGIIKKDSESSKYDTLINLSKLAGKPGFMKSLSTAAQNFQDALAFLDQAKSQEVEGNE